MSNLHMSKVAVGCTSLDALARRQRSRICDGVDRIRTRFRPKRADELVGGSIYWIIAHRLTARQTIIGFDIDAAEGKTVIRLQPELVPVRAKPKRAHQGWRYLDPGDAPPDLDGSHDDGVAALPPLLWSRLAALALI
jgi:hypothetical protein